MRKLIFLPTIILSICVHGFQSRYTKLVLLSVQTCKENSSGRSFSYIFLHLKQMCDIFEICFMTQIPVPWCTRSQVHSLLHIRSSQFSLWHQALLFHSVMLCELARCWCLGEKCWIWDVLPCDGCAALYLQAFQPRLLSPHILPWGAAPAMSTGEQRTDLSVFSWMKPHRQVWSSVSQRKFRLCREFLSSVA